MSDPTTDAKFTDQNSDPNVDKTQKKKHHRQKYQKKDEAKGEDTITQPPKEKKQKVKDQNNRAQLKEDKKTKNAKSDTQKQPANTQGKKTKKQQTMSQEEKLLREQRKQIIADINDYLNDQYNPQIAPINDDFDDEYEDNDYEEEKVQDVDDDVLKPQAPQRSQKKQNILQPLMHSGVFIPPSITRQAIQDALDVEDEEDDPDEVDPIVEPMPYVLDPADPNYVNELPAANQSSSSISYFLLIMFMIIGSIYYVLNEAIKRRQREEEPEKYESGGDNLLGERRGGATDQAQKYFTEAQKLAERFARGVLHEIEQHSIIDFNLPPPNGTGNRRPNRRAANGGPYVPREDPTAGARPLESLASQSENILGSTASTADDPYKESPSVIVKEKKKKSEKKKEQQEAQDDNYDQA